MHTINLLSNMACMVLLPFNPSSSAGDYRRGTNTSSHRNFYFGGLPLMCNHNSSSVDNYQPNSPQSECQYRPLSSVEVGMKVE
jgi:hypothetical protein